MKNLLPLLHGDSLTVTRKTLPENVSGARVQNDDIIRSPENALQPEGGLALLHGNLAPQDAMIKHSAATASLLRHRGRAVVFKDYEDLLARLNDPDLDVTPDDVLVLQSVGPVGGPGMPELGNFPVPLKLLRQGVRDMVRISDGRMSGTAFGTIVLHVAPESAVAGSLALVRDGDQIELDVPARRLQLYVDVDPAEMARRRDAW